NNHEKIHYKKNGLIYISHYRPNRKLFEGESRLLRIIKKFCIRKRLNLKILGKHKNKDHQYNEKEWFKSILKTNFRFIGNSKKRKTYEILGKSMIVVSSGSTMGLESLGRKNKTAIIQAKPNTYRKKFWGYYTKRKKYGFFWSIDVNEKKVFKILNNLNSISKQKWDNKLNNYIYETCKYDYKNYKLKNKIVKICYQNKFNVKPYLI
ncbi:hypothetical protein OA496_02405, partial [Pelagibacteraceae bacterium]|nr:hypothetical protein [Pelagibacteraceae bacterium]